MPDPRDAESKTPDDLAGGQGAATPDEDGPHDVPDEKVIEKTLPSVPVDLGESKPG